MIEKIMKAVKRGNKKRSRNITIGAVIGFLLSCTAVMGATSDKYLWIEKDDNDGKIKFNTTATTDGDGKWEEENPYNNNNWDTGTKTYTNNIELSSSKVNDKDGNKEISYGLRLSGDLTDVNFVNNGSIIGKVSGGNGYGIYNKSGTMKNITNAGVISGSGIYNGSSASYGSGIYNKSGTMKNITNAGVISGTGSSSSGYGFGYGIYNSGTMKNITNTGLISGTGSSGSGTGYGIYNSLGTIGDITNAGIINGYGNSTSGKGTGYGIYNFKSEMENITNTGLISGTGNSTSDAGTGSGIYNDSDDKEMGAITNTGVISGSGFGGSSSDGKGSGINNESGTIGDIENTGLISGSGSSSSGVGAGFGIYNAATMGDITNTGLISGSGSSSSSYGFGYGINNNLGTIGALTNTGIISGIGNSTNSSGFGIYNSGPMENITNRGLIIGYDGIYNNSSEIKNITNAGLISGIGNSTDGTGSGIYNYKPEIKNITNTGVISGSITSGYGIYNFRDSEQIGAITNTGVIYGTDNAIKKEGSGTIDPSSNYGILVNGDDGEKVIDGLGIVDATPTNDQILNKGLIFKAVDGGYKATAEEYKQFGKIYKDESIVIDYQEDGTGLKKPITKEYTIINAKAVGDKTNISKTESLKLGNGTLTYGDSSTINISSDKRYILNGITNTLEVSEGNNELNGSVINAYGTAVVFGDTGDKELTLSGTIVNGGIDVNNPDTRGIAISGSNGEDTLILQSIASNEGTQNTVVNGNINMGDGADTLTIGDGTIINGTLDGGDSDFKDTLNFGISSVAKSNPADSQEIKIMHNISNFENMNIEKNTNVTLFEKTIGADGKETALELSGVEEINIKAGGVLNLRIASQTSTDGRYKGHALFGNTGLKINGDISQLPDGKTEIEEREGEKYKVGVFNLITNGLGINSIIAMDGITLDENLFVKTNSILDKATILKESEGDIKAGDIKIEGEKDIFEMYVDKSKRYIKLNEIYKGIYSSKEENFNALKDILTLSGAGGDYTSVTDKEQLATLLSYLSNIYTETPYSFSSELSRKSTGMFRDIITENQFKPNLNQWLIMGGLTHRDGGTKDIYYGKNYHGFDTGTADVDVDMKLTGAYALGKYGYSENVSLGVTAGGNKSEAKLPMSKVKGNSGYVGAFAENYRGNLTLKAGAGIQYSEYDADRGTLGGHSYSDKYSDMTYDIYLNGRYSHNIGENLFLEPYGILSYTYVDQEGANEGSKVLAIETDSKTFDYTAAKVGVDLKKVIPHEKGKSTLSAGVSYTRLLTGADEENITGRFKGENATDFDILVAHKNKHSIGLNAKYALELENGILFDVKGSYNVERDSHNGTGKNRNKGEWIVGAGIGYKF